MASYIDLQRRFWAMHRKQRFTAYEIAIYQYLLAEANLRKWPEPLAISNRDMLLGLDVSESTLLKARATLQARGVLRFIPGQTKRKSPEYYLADYPAGKGNKKGNDPVDYPANYPADYPVRKGIYKDIEDIEDERESHAHTREGHTPAKAEIFDYFRLEGLTASPEEFFDYYQARGWNAGGVPVVDWRALARSWNRREESMTRKKAKENAKPFASAARRDKSPRRVNDRWADFKLPDECKTDKPTTTE